MRIVKIVQIVGAVLGVASTAISGWATNKTMKEMITKEVAKAIVNQTKGS